jgi:ATP-dependent DNA helicase PIF1
MAQELASNIVLQEKQDEAYQYMVSGKNVFITGSAGTGKTSVIKKFQEVASVRKVVAITSTTGTSAILLGGTTLHSYLKIGLGQASVDALVEQILKAPPFRKRWQLLQVLIIDEISMLSPELFDKLEEIARRVRGNNCPFGGIQLILSGDFCQLPVVNSDKFCFEAESWGSCIDHTIYLTKIIRQTEVRFQECLNFIRVGVINDFVAEVLESRVGVKLANDFGIKPTKLFPTNHVVDQINTKKLNKLKGDFREYEMEFKAARGSGAANRNYAFERFRKNCNVPEVIHLAVGAQVMLLYNMDLEAKLANGSRGVIEDFVDDLPLVRFLDGQTRIIDYHTWDVKENDVPLLAATQIPLRLAWAITIHKSQGCSLDYVEIDLTDIFEYGQAYVALSRAKTLDGLSIKGLVLDKIAAHPKAIEFYKAADEDSDT